MPSVAAAPGSIIVVGVPKSSRAVLTEDRQALHTYYTLQVTDVLKGRDVGPVVTVRTLGGLIQFDDGTSARVSVQGEMPLEIDRRYLLFLRRDGGNPADVEEGVLQITSFGTAGFKLGETLGVAPISAHYRALEGSSVLTFVEQVRAAAER